MDRVPGEFDEVSTTHGRGPARGTSIEAATAASGARRVFYCMYIDRDRKHAGLYSSSSNEPEQPDSELKRAYEAAQRTDKEWFDRTFRAGLEVPGPSTQRRRKRDKSDEELQMQVNKGPRSSSVGVRDEPQQRSKAKATGAERHRVRGSDKDSNTTRSTGEEMDSLRALGYSDQDIAALRASVIQVLISKAVRKPSRGLPVEWTNRTSQAEEPAPRVPPTSSTSASSYTKARGSRRENIPDEIQSFGDEDFVDTIQSFADNRRLDADKRREEDYYAELDVEGGLLPPAEEFRELLMDESRWRLGVTGTWLAPLVRAETRWRYSLYQNLLTFLDKGWYPDDADVWSDENDKDKREQTKERGERSAGDRSARDRYDFLMEPSTRKLRDKQFERERAERERERQTGSERSTRRPQRDWDTDWEEGSDEV